MGLASCKLTPCLVHVSCLSAAEVITAEVYAAPTTSAGKKLGKPSTALRSTKITSPCLSTSRVLSALKKGVRTRCLVDSYVRSTTSTFPNNVVVRLSGTKRIASYPSSGQSSGRLTTLPGERPSTPNGSCQQPKAWTNSTRNFPAITGKPSRTTHASTAGIRESSMTTTSR